MKIALVFLMLCFSQPALAITIATGTPEGTYYQIAQDIKRIAQEEGIAVEVIQTNGSFDNINLLGSGKVDLAILQLDVAQVYLRSYASRGRFKRSGGTEGGSQSLFRGDPRYCKQR